MAKCWSRKNRKNRRNTRRNRRANRRNTRRRMMYGGANNSTGPAPVDYGLAQTPEAQMNLAQGRQFAGYHVNQHGGEAPYPLAVVDSTLPTDLHASARTQPLDGYFNDIRGLRDPNQMGAGRRRRRNNLSGMMNNIGASMRRIFTRRNMNTRRRRGRRNNMMGGAATYNFDPASTSAPGLLLDASTEARAVRGMNPEWYLAPDPNAFTPKA